MKIKGKNLALFITVLVTVLGFVGWRLHYVSTSTLLDQGKLSRIIEIQPFSLTNNKNTPFTEKDLQGRWTFMFFGYTSCPDVCPATLSEMTLLNQRINELDKIKSGELKRQFVFISVDPARDTIPVLNDFITYFDPEFIAATSTIEKLNLLTNQVGIRHRRIDQNRAEYLVEHSADVLLINPAGELLAKFKAPHDAEKLITAFTSLVNNISK